MKLEIWFLSLFLSCRKPSEFNVSSILWSIKGKAFVRSSKGERRGEFFFFFLQVIQVISRARRIEFHLHTRFLFRSNPPFNFCIPFFPGFSFYSFTRVRPARCFSIYFYEMKLPNQCRFCRELSRIELLNCTNKNKEKLF